MLTQLAIFWSRYTSAVYFVIRLFLQASGPVFLELADKLIPKANQR